LTKQEDPELLGYRCHGYLCEETIEIGKLNEDETCPHCGSPFVYPIYDAGEEER
jgi:rRNA maturation endonuclease Nob1